MYELSPTSCYRICHDYLLSLPSSNSVTRTYCSRFSPVLMVDGKHIQVKGYTSRIPLLWGIDYFKHDVPFFVLAPSESYSAWATYMRYFRTVSHRPQLVVCDDNQNIKLAARSTFPSVRIQTCINHLKENIRRQLSIRTDEKYRPFFIRLSSLLSQKLSPHTFVYWASLLVRDYGNDPVIMNILTHMHAIQHELHAYRGIPQAPLTTNLMESFNSHLESRIFSIKGFESFTHARLWLNGYILKRRETPYRECTGKFRFLNGKTPLSQTIKHGLVLPSYF